MKKAIRDIPVIKLLEQNPYGDLFSSMFYCKWSIGELVKSEMGEPFIVDNFYYGIGKGLHAFRKNRKSVDIINRTFSLILSACISTNARYDSNLHPIITIAHIPRGANYYLNEGGEYVSNQLVIDQIMSEEDCRKKGICTKNN